MSKPWTPGRTPQPVFPPSGGPPAPTLVHPGGLGPAPWNPRNLDPGLATPRGVEAWSNRQGQRFRPDENDNLVWTWQSVVFDFRPGMSAAYGMSAAATPINHEAALGMSTFLNVIIGSASGAHPPALIGNFEVEYWEDGNNVTSDEMFRLTQEIQITDLVAAGGTRTARPFGVSSLGFSPCQIGLRFWQLSIRMTIPGLLIGENDLYVQACVH